LEIILDNGRPYTSKKLNTTKDLYLLWHTLNSIIRVKGTAGIYLLIRGCALLDKEWYIALAPPASDPPNVICSRKH